MGKLIDSYHEIRQGTAQCTAEANTSMSIDETVVNGAQAFYKHQFGIGGDSARDTWLLGLVNGAPYLCCAVFGCCKFSNPGLSL